METPENPPCENWNIWEGPEVEGFHQIGELTLFVRRGIHFPCYLTPKHKRIWICKQFLGVIHRGTGLRIIEALRERRPDIMWAFEIPFDDLEHFEDLRAFGQLYVKLDLEGRLQPRDVVCIGKPYQDQFIQLNSAGRVVHPAQYNNDVCLEA